MIYYRKKKLTSIAEIWYNTGEKPEKKVDILRYKYAPPPPPEKERRRCDSLEELYTLLLDLSKNEETLFSGIRKNTKYEINRAKSKDDIKGITFFELKEKNDNKIAQYIDFFNKFTDSKGRSHINFSDIEQFYNTDTFCIRCAVCENESEFLTVHAYVVSDNTARLHQSASLFREREDTEYRNMIGRANRLLHWDDILYFKNKGIGWYDFGGWYGGEATNENYREQLLINQFKESFGGEKKQEYSYIVPVTIKGKMAAMFRAIIKTLRKKS